MKFQEAVETCLVKKYADFDSLATRSEYWWFALFCGIVGLLLSMFSQTLSLLFWLAVLVPSVAVSARRLRDTGRHPLLLLLGLIPLVGDIVLIVFFVQRGRTEPTPI